MTSSSSSSASSSLRIVSGVPLTSKILTVGQLIVNSFSCLEMSQKRYKAFVERLLQRMHIRSHATLFTKEEKEQLLMMLQGSYPTSKEKEKRRIQDIKDLQTVISGMCYIFESVIYQGVKRDGFKLLLLEIGFTTEFTEVTEEIWINHGANLVSKLREKATLGGPGMLSDIDYHLQLTTSSSSISKTHTTKTILDFTTVSKPSELPTLAYSSAANNVLLNDNDVVNTNNTAGGSGNAGSMKKETSTLSLEFSHNELYDFFCQLETIQTQLDRLT